MRRAPQQPQRLDVNPHAERIDSLCAMVPQRFDEFADARLGDDVGRHAEAQPFQGAMQNAQSRAAQRRLELAQITGKAEKTNRLSGEELPQRRIAGRFGAAEQVRQTLHAVESA